MDHDETFCKITANQSAFTNGTVHIEEKSSTIKVMQFTLTLAPNNPDARVSSAAIQCFGIVACEIKFEQLTGKILRNIILLLIIALESVMNRL